MTLRHTFDRLGTGERWWAAELVLRGAGLALLAGCMLTTLWLYRSVHRPPGHAASVVEFLAAAGAVIGGCGGAMLVWQGPGLFELVPIPSRTIHHLKIGGDRT